MKTIDQWLGAAASEIEGQLQRKLAPYLSGPKKHLSVKVCREEGHYSFHYSFKVFINDEFTCISRCMDWASHDPNDHLDIDRLVESLASKLISYCGIAVVR